MELVVHAGDKSYMPTDIRSFTEAEIIFFEIDFSDGQEEKCSVAVSVLTPAVSLARFASMLSSRTNISSNGDSRTG